MNLHQSAILKSAKLILFSVKNVGKVFEDFCVMQGDDEVILSYGEEENAAGCKKTENIPTVLIRNSTKRHLNVKTPQVFSCGVAGYSYLFLLLFLSLPL